MSSRLPQPRILAPLLLALLLLIGASTTTTVAGFQSSPMPTVGRPTASSSSSSPSSSWSWGATRIAAPSPRLYKLQPTSTSAARRTDTALHMFMGSDGGILGIGGPELATILLVGYFVLGPSDLYKLVKEIGKFVQNIQALGTDLSTTLESNMESTLQLEELRKAQQELTDAFSFRRSINVDDTDAFATTVNTPRAEGAVAEVAAVAATAITDTDTNTDANANTDTDTAVPPKKKKIRRRRVKKQVPVMTDDDDVDNNEYSGEIPDLDMNAAFPELDDESVSTDDSSSSSATSTMTAEEEAEIEREFDQYTTTDGPNPMSEWYENSMAATQAADSQDDDDDDGEQPSSTGSSEEQNQSQSRFQQQLSGNWNDQVLANQKELEPLAKVMELLALLEQEKVDADKRIAEEYRRRTKLDDEFYQKQRRVLEDAVAQVQQAAEAATVDNTQ